MARQKARGNRAGKKPSQEDEEKQKLVEADQDNDKVEADQDDNDKPKEDDENCDSDNKEYEQDESDEEEEKSMRMKARRIAIKNREVSDDDDIPPEIIVCKRCPPKSVWSKFPPVVEGVHFKRPSNRGIRLTLGTGYLCMIQDMGELCQNFAKKVSFVNHFRTYHSLNPDPIKRGHLGKLGKVPRTLNRAAQWAQTERQKGNFLL